MLEKEIRKLLRAVRRGSVRPEEALSRLRDLPFSDIGFAKIDHHRRIRTGYPEVIYCEGKTIPQITAIGRRVIDRERNLLATRASPEVYDALAGLDPACRYNEPGRVVSLRKTPPPKRPGAVVIVAAGTSDIPVLEEAAATLEFFGHRPTRLADVGVAGIHRLLAHAPALRAADVVICIAGMEGALASVVGGLVSIPVVAVPTSVGYGASFRGLTALLSMLNSCAPGVVTVNIDNGFGAAYAASLIVSSRSRSRRGAS